MLLDLDTCSCEPVRDKRKGWPKEFKQPKSLKLKTGETKKLQKGQLIATVWHDQRDVCILSTNVNPLEASIRKVRQGKELVDVPNLAAVKSYVQCMGDVDLNDQNRTYYFINRKSNKWWKHIFYFVVDVCIFNAFKLYELTNTPSKKEDITHL